jgi:hypothetical protein
MNTRSTSTLGMIALSWILAAVVLLDVVGMLEERVCPPDSRPSISPRIEGPGPLSGRLSYSRHGGMGQPLSLARAAQR